MNVLSVEQILREGEYHKTDWQRYKARLYKVDLTWIKKSYDDAPNEATKIVMKNRAYFYNRMVEGYEFLAAAS